MKRVFIILLVLLVSMPALTGCSSEGTRVGEKAPDFRLTNLQGQSVALGGLQGKTVMLNFWGSWCPPCRLEMPFIQAAHDKWSGKGLVILAVNIGESAATVRQFMQSNRYTFPVLLDSEEDVAGQYGIDTIPASYFIDKDGVIRDRVVGAFPSLSAIEKYLNKLMAQ